MRTTMPDHPDADLSAAFRELHGRSLHGFALVLLLGDRAAAAALAGTTLEVVGADAARLRHPERAAAALRADLRRRARRARIVRGLSDGQLATLAGLGIGTASARALGSMTLRDRAALISADIERFGEDDVATILGTSTPQARRAAATARRRFVERHPGGDLDAPPAPNSIGARVVAVSQRTMGGRA